MNSGYEVFWNIPKLNEPKLDILINSDEHNNNNNDNGDGGNNSNSPPPPTTATTTTLLKPGDTWKEVWKWYYECDQSVSIISYIICSSYDSLLPYLLQIYLLLLLLLLPPFSRILF